MIYVETTVDERLLGEFISAQSLIRVIEYIAYVNSDFDFSDREVPEEIKRIKKKYPASVTKEMARIGQFIMEAFGDASATKLEVQKND